MGDIIERRKYKRYKSEIPIRITNNGVEAEGYTYGLSVAGICAYVDKPFSIGSKVHVTLSVPKKDVIDVEEIKIIGEVVKVEEVSSADGRVNVSLNIKFQNISEQDIISLKSFFKEIAPPPPSSPSSQKKLEDNIDLDAVEVEGLDSNILPMDTSNMGFFEKMQMSEDYSDTFTKYVKWFIGAGITALLLYLFYYIYLMILKLVKLG